MSSIAFDTLKFVHRLRESGISEPQAEAIAEAFAEATSQELVTKSDVRELASRSDLKELELRLTLRVASIVTAGVAVLFTLERLFPAR